MTNEERWTQAKEAVVKKYNWSMFPSTVLSDAFTEAAFIMADAIRGEYENADKALLKKAFDAGYDYRNQETEDGSPFRGKVTFAQWYKKNVPNHESKKDKEIAELKKEKEQLIKWYVI